MGTITFVVKGKKPRTWAIGQKNRMAIKPGTDDVKFINYYKGRDSIFMETYEDKKEIKPNVVPLFEFNPSTNRTELTINDTDKNLILYLTSHPDYNKKYEMSSPDLEAQKKIDGYSKIKEALKAIENASESPKAAAVAVLGFSYFTKTDKVCVAALEEKAFKSPDDVIKIVTSPKFPAREIAAFCNGIIKLSPSATEVVWGSDNGIILSLATGEDGLQKLTEKLCDGSQTGQVLLQEISSKVDKKIADKKAEDQSKDDEIAELKRQLAEAKKPAAKKDTEDVPDLPLEEAAKAYKEKTGNDVPTRYKNDASWINRELRKTDA